MTAGAWSSATAALLASLGIEPGDLLAGADSLRQEGHGAMLVAVDGKAAGLVAVADPIKDSAVGRAQGAACTSVFRS